MVCYRHTASWLLIADTERLFFLVVVFIQAYCIPRRWHAASETHGNELIEREFTTVLSRRSLRQHATIFTQSISMLAVTNAAATTWFVIFMGSTGHTPSSIIMQYCRWYPTWSPWSKKLPPQTNIGIRKVQQTVNVVDSVELCNIVDQSCRPTHARQHVSYSSIPWYTPDAT